MEDAKRAFWNDEAVFPLTVDCSLCGAKAGEACRYDDDSHYKDFHLVRQAAARADAVAKYGPLLGWWVEESCGISISDDYFSTEAAAWLDAASRLAPASGEVEQEDDPNDISKDVRNGFVCGAWKKVLEGDGVYVMRCDRPDGHKGYHVDKVLLTNWDGPTPKTAKAAALAASQPPSALHNADSGKQGEGKGEWTVDELNQAKEELMKRGREYVWQHRNDKFPQDVGELLAQELICELNALRDRLAAGNSGVAMIAAERARQVESEGWTLEHDDDHVFGEVTEEDRTAAVMELYPSGYAVADGFLLCAAAEIKCRERQLREAFGTIAQYEKDEALKRFAVEEYEKAVVRLNARVAELESLPSRVPQGVERPTPVATVNHGSGFTSYYPCAEANAHFDKLEAMIADKQIMLDVRTIEIANAEKENDGLIDEVARLRALLAAKDAEIAEAYAAESLGSDRLGARYEAYCKARPKPMMTFSGWLNKRMGDAESAEAQLLSTTAALEGARELLQDFKGVRDGYGNFRDDAILALLPARNGEREG